MKELAGKTGVWDLRLISLPFFCFNLILPWLKVFPIPQLSLGFPRLIALMNFFPSAVPQTTEDADFQFSSASSDRRAVEHIAVLAPERQTKVHYPPFFLFKRS